MNSNLALQTTVVLLLLAHVAALLGLWFGPRTIGIMLSLNAVVALAVLAYAGSRARIIFNTHDRQQIALAVFELSVMAGAIWAFRNSRPAIVWSYIVFVLHFLTTIAAVVFAFAFKMTRLF